MAMRRLGNASFLFFLMVLLLLGCTQQGPRVRIGQSLPAVELAGLDGEEVSLPTAFLGSFVVLLFWEKDCPYCAAEMPLSEAVYRKFRDRGFVFVAINVGNDRSEVEEAVSGMDITYPVLLDPKAATRKKFGVRGLPTMFFVDRQGVVKEKILGGLRAATLETMVEESL